MSMPRLMQRISALLLDPGKEQEKVWQGGEPDSRHSTKERKELELRQRQKHSCLSGPWRWLDRREKEEEERMENGRKGGRKIRKQVKERKIPLVH